MSSSEKNNRIGLTRVMNNGLKATIIEYIKSAHIYVLFENGVRQRGTYSKFLNGTLTGKHMEDVLTIKQRVGQKQKMRCGEVCKVIKFNGYEDVYVEFENSKVVKHASWYAFKTGQISNAPKIDINKHVGKTFFSKTCGLNFTILEKADKQKSSFLIQFEDGTKKICEYKSAVKCNVTHPCFTRAGVMKNFYGYSGKRKTINGIFYWIIDNIGLITPQQILCELQLNKN